MFVNMLVRSKVVGILTFLLKFQAVVARNLEFSLYNDVASCLMNEYFDHISLKCVACPVNQTTEDPYTCTCFPGFKSVYNEKNELNCEECPSFYVASNDKLSCIPCEAESYFNATTKQCDPCTDPFQIMIDKGINGTYLDNVTCLDCSPETIPGQGICIPCHSSYYAASGGRCSCPKTHVEINGICVPQTELAQIPDKTSSYTVLYEDGKKIQSSFFETHFRMAAHACTFSKNFSSCQLLSNLCVLIHYTFDDDYNACRYYRGEFGDNFINLPNHVPWLYYTEGEANVYLSKTRLKTHYSFKEDNPDSKFNFTVAKYSPEGHLIQYGRLEDVLTVCPLISFDLDDAIKFGTTFTKSCSISVRDLWDKYDTVFYDVFIQYYDEEDHMIYAVPILNRNYVEKGEKLNQQSEKKWQLMRRFFLFDNLSGRESLSPNTPDRMERAKVVRYAQNIEIVIRLREGEGHGLIFPPLIKITYGEVSDDQYELNTMVETSFRVLYTMDFSKITDDLSISIGVMSAFAMLWSMITTWSWSRRCGKLSIDLPTIFHLILTTCGNLANVFFLVMFFSCLYWTIFFKRQDVVYLFLLTDSQEWLIKQYLIAACFLKLAQIIQILYVQVTLDMFIIDWEQPRAKNSLPHPQLSNSLDEEDKSKSEQPISIWRTYFITNEWNELQTHRKIDVGYQLFFTLLFLNVIGFENLSSADPRSNFQKSDTEYNPPQSYVCRFAISITVFVVIAVVQWFFKTVFYERCVENKIQQFVDLCSIANISIFILQHTVYGYYIHGRSVHGYADVDMHSFYEQLKREEEDLCGHRGLEPSSECQIFEVAITHKFREQYDTILRPVHGFVGMRRPSNRGRMASAEMEQSFKAHETMKRFFGMFLQHALKDLNYIVKEKLFLESLLDLEFQEPDDRCLFFRDNNHAFESVLLSGHEVSFVLFEILLFTFVDLLAENFVLAGFVTFVVSYTIKKVRYAFGRKNVVSKTLVDQRFLI